MECAGGRGCSCRLMLKVFSRPYIPRQQVGDENCVSTCFAAATAGCMSDICIRTALASPCLPTATCPSTSLYTSIYPRTATDCLWIDLQRDRLYLCKHGVVHAATVKVPCIYSRPYRWFLRHRSFRHVLLRCTMSYCYHPLQESVLAYLSGSALVLNYSTSGPVST